MVPEQHKEDFASQGLIVVPSVISAQTVAAIHRELSTAREEDLLHRPDVFDRGMVHNCMFRGPTMARILNLEVINLYVQTLLAPTAILYAYQSSSAPPGAGNYGSRVHVDSPRFIPGYMTNLGVIIPLSDFTSENGGTLYLPGSHLCEELPEESGFFENCSVAECKAGDMIVFNARLAHATGINTTETIRHAITLNFCRSFMRQRFDFCRMKEATEEFLAGLNEDGKRLLGMNVRMPVSLEEFYLPAGQRLYKPGQG